LASVRDPRGRTARALSLTLLASACGVPDLKIVEANNSATALDGSTVEAEMHGDAAAPPAKPSDAGTPRGTDPPRGAAGATAGTRGQSTGSAGMAAPEPPAANGGCGPAGGRGGVTGSIAGRGGAPSGAADAGVPMQPPPAECIVWRSVSARESMPPAEAVEGGLETVAGQATRQYVCRTQPDGSPYAIPGKYIPGLGCYVAWRRSGQVVDVSVLDGMIDVLTPGPGCSFSWRSASGSALPPGAVDLGDPAGGPNYACHGFYSSIASSGMQIGAIIQSTDDPPLNQCWFQSFVGASQPQDPTEFEVLALDGAS
jgi:hypothetical protein